MVAIYAPSSIFVRPLSAVIVQAQPGRLAEVSAAIQQRDLTRILSFGPLKGIRPWSATAFTAARAIPEFNMHAAVLDAVTITDLAQNPSVAAIYLDKQVQISQAFPAAPPSATYSVKVPSPSGKSASTLYFTSTEETRKLLGADVANASGFSGQGMKACVVDTGGHEHPQTSRAGFQTAIPGNYVDICSHGQWCLSALGGTRYQDHLFSREIGVPIYCQGMAPMAGLLAIKALDFVIGTAPTSILLHGLAMALNAKPDVVSLSWGSAVSGTTPQADPFYPAMEALDNAGILVFAASGNGGPGAGTLDSPGALPQPITVGAWNAVTNTFNSMFGEAGTMCNFSSRGPTPWGTTKPDTCLTGDSLIGTCGGPPERIDAIKTDYISTIDSGGLRRGTIMERFDNGTRNVLTVKTRHRSLTMTPNHRILTYLAIPSREPSYLLTEAGRARLRLFRQKRGMTLKRMADALGIPSYQSYSRIEDRRRGTSIDRLRDFFRTVGESLQPSDYELHDVRDHYQRSIGWYPAKKLVPGDLILTSPPMTQEGIVVSPPVSPLRRKKSHTLILPEEVSPDLAQFLGFYLGDGSSSAYQIHLCAFNFLEDYWILTGKLFPGVSMNHNGKCILISSRQVSELIHSLGLGGTARTKRIPEWLFSASMECRERFLWGYVDADGHRRRGEASVSSVSPDIAYGLHALCDGMEISISNVSRRLRPGTHIQGRQLPPCLSYEFSIYGLPRSIAAPYVVPSPVPGTRLERIRQIENMGKERVYDLSVHPCHNYLANGIVVHNCAPGAIIDSGVSPFSQMALSYTNRPHSAQALAGTSMSTPQAAGMGTLMRQAHQKLLGKTLTNTEIKQMLAALGLPKTNDYGWGPLTWSLYREWLSTQYGVTL